MDRGISSKQVDPGVSVRNGPVEEMDIDKPVANGATNGKRKSRNSLQNGKSYKESSSDEDDKPMVRCILVPYEAVCADSLIE